ncbi:MAG TPA: HAMP domain-containing sensor histidine kinase [Phycisphaerae bacterium]|nr:HAMP domain-containing sensor histidine kinase [Phycisphaerae bacterium]
MDKPVERPTSCDEDLKKAVLGRFSSGLVHDLRSPLMVIRLSLEVIRSSAPPTPQATEALNMIDEAVNEANQFLTDLVEITHDWEPESAETDLTALLSDVCAEVDLNRKIVWQFDLGAKPLTIWCDPTRFRRVLHKLFQNSITAMRGQGNVYVRARQLPDTDVIEVQDSGPGPDMALRDTLFEPFVTTKRAGMGLGLTYCQEVVRRHGGSIQLMEPCAPGATFRIILPQKTDQKK